MRKNLFALGLLLLTVPLLAQSVGVLDYKRNSLATILVFHPEDEFGPDIHEAYLALPMPDKYDDHNLQWRIIDNSQVQGVQRSKSGLFKATYGHPLSNTEIEQNAQYFETLLNNAQVGKYMVAKWFNMSSMDTSAVFDTELIQQRGQYSASDVDVELALQTVRGVAALSDAGLELIGHTFVLVNDITYVTAEEEAAAAKTGMAIIGGLLDAFLGGKTGRQLADGVGAIADSFTGFNVKTHSYLYELVWNDSIADIFYKYHYTAKPNAAKIQAFLDDQSTFRVRYVAHEYEYDKKSTLKGKYDRSELVKTICARSVDKNIVALGKQYEDFKVKTPVYSVLENKGTISGYTAKIGLKEGITESSKFQVVQRLYNPETKVTSYKYIATVQPVKGQIWDNRYNAVLEQDAGSNLNYTTFKKVSGGEILPGMLLIEGRYRKVQE
ncbi:MAG: hypothetical protein MJZ75_00025 [Paludibacteraceae bacterium]|nr:hypothetical protein [Paludibacteraceae bacterium]